MRDNDDKVAHLSLLARPDVRDIGLWVNVLQVPREVPAL